MYCEKYETTFLSKLRSDQHRRFITAYSTTLTLCMGTFNIKDETNNVLKNDGPRSIIKLTCTYIVNNIITTCVQRGLVGDSKVDYKVVNIILAFKKSF